MGSGTTYSRNVEEFKRKTICTAKHRVCINFYVSLIFFLPSSLLSSSSVVVRTFIAAFRYPLYSHGNVSHRLLYARTNKHSCQCVTILVRDRLFVANAWLCLLRFPSFLSWCYSISRQRTPQPHFSFVKSGKKSEKYIYFNSRFMKGVHFNK